MTSGSHSLPATISLPEPFIGLTRGKSQKCNSCGKLHAPTATLGFIKGIERACKGAMEKRGLEQEKDRRTNEIKWCYFRAKEGMAEDRVKGIEAVETQSTEREGMGTAGAGVRSTTWFKMLKRKETGQEARRKASLIRVRMYELATQVFNLFPTTSRFSPRRREGGPTPS